MKTKREFWKPRLDDKTKWGRIFAIGKSGGPKKMCFMKDAKGNVTVLSWREVSRRGRLLMIIGAFLSAAFSTARAELTPSIGVNYSTTKIGDKGAAPGSSFLSNLQMNTAVVDLRIPISKSVEFTFSGGRAWGSVDAWNRNFVLNAVTANPSGGIIGVFGNTSAAPYRQNLDGYTFSVGARWYLGGK